MKNLSIVELATDVWMALTTTVGGSTTA